MTPPQTTYEVHEMFGGYTGGPTSLAYFFFRLADLYSDVQVAGHPLVYWTKQYLEGDRGEVEITTRVPTVLGPYPDLEKDPGSSPNHKTSTPSRPGRCYLRESFQISEQWGLREERRSVGYSGASASKSRAYQLCPPRIPTGADHGTIGIITQLVVTTPSLAPRLKTKLRAVLDLQVDGNWPRNFAPAGDDNPFLMQWYHGAPGFIVSLKAIRPYFPDMQGQIDAAIANAQEAIWKHGSIKKEPSLCHGILGNALALPRGPRREHFLSLVTVEAIEEAKRLEPGVFKRTDYGQDTTITFKYHSSAAWTWAVCQQEDPLMLFQTDI